MACSVGLKLRVRLLLPDGADLVLRAASPPGGTFTYDVGGIALAAPLAADYLPSVDRVGLKLRHVPPWDVHGRETELVVSAPVGR